MDRSSAPLLCVPDRHIGDAPIKRQHGTLWGGLRAIVVATVRRFPRGRHAWWAATIECVRPRFERPSAGQSGRSALLIHSTPTLLNEGGSKRREAASAAIESVGATLDCMYYAFGESDIYGICDFPDVASATAVSLMINATGAVTKAVDNDRTWGRDTSKRDRCQDPSTVPGVAVGAQSTMRGRAG